jgi:hypothetical protein
LISYYKTLLKANKTNINKTTNFKYVTAYKNIITQNDDLDY